MICLGNPIECSDLQIAPEFNLKAGFMPRWHLGGRLADGV